jgi:hypothetical protein
MVIASVSSSKFEKVNFYHVVYLLITLKTRTKYVELRKRGKEKERKIQKFSKRSRLITREENASGCS